MKFIQQFVCLGADAAQRKAIATEPKQMKAKVLQAYPPCTEEKGAYLASLGTFVFAQGIRVLEEDSESFISFAVHREDNSLVYCAAYLYTRSLDKRSVRRLPEALVLIAERPYLNLMLGVLEHMQVLCSRHPRFHKHQVQHLYRPDQRELYISAVLFNLALPQRTVEYLHYPPRTKAGNYAQLKVLCRVTQHTPRSIPNYSFVELLRNVPPQYLVRTVTALLLERKVVVKSVNEGLLTSCCELLISFLNPFDWPHSYVPYLPPQMHSYVEAPLIFVIGVSSNAVVPAEVFVLDVDSGSTSVPSDVDLPQLPAEEEALLYRALVVALEAVGLEDLYGWHRCVLKYRQAFYECWMRLVFLYRSSTPRQDREFWDCFGRTFMMQTLLQEAQLDQSHQSEEVRRFFNFIRMLKTESWDSIRDMQNLDVETQLRDFAAPELVSLLSIFERVRPCLDTEIKPEAAMPLEADKSNYHRVRHWTTGAGWRDLENDWLGRLSYKGSRGHIGLSIE
jgi:hypothetical protein